MTHRFESSVEAQLREARERGDFENLPGYGKPIADLDGNHDEMWWIRNWLKRNDIGFTPPAIALRKAAEDLLGSLDKFPTERGLRNALDELNVRIREMNRSPVLEGPPSNLMPLDVEPVIARWSETRPTAPARGSRGACSDGQTPLVPPASVIIRLPHGGVGQWLDRRPFKPRVAGSIPATPTKSQRKHNNCTKPNTCSRRTNFRRYAGYVEQVIEPSDEEQPIGADPVDDLDRLAVVEAELSDAEAELDSMDHPTVDQDASPDL